ncbi:nuclear transport factor 2 family protein [Tepidicaulis sp. LMO-SS28]|uniref:nuclear transport factor 2 family protein n=1 Tax=Tepidicaulis sp. LMO-SS28 TaxID=3447455 RepID=UPI003EE32CFB
MGTPTPEEERNLAATQALFAAFGAKDVDRIVTFLAPEPRIEFYGPPVIPYADTYEGLEACRRFFETVLSSVDIHIFEPEEFIASGPKVIVTGHLHLTARATGRDIISDFVHVIDLEEGKWRRFRDFMNTAEAAAAFS